MERGMCSRKRGETFFDALIYSSSCFRVCVCVCVFSFFVLLHDEYSYNKKQSLPHFETHSIKEYADRRKVCAIVPSNLNV